MNDGSLIERGTTLALAILLLGLTSCQGPEPAPLATPTPPTDNADRGIVLQLGTPGARLLEACHQDQECVQPLRCLELACAVPPAVDGVGAPDSPRVVFGNNKTVWLEVAATEFQRRRGLMYRTRMHSDWGMLFIFPDEEQRSFWMRNTLIPLDMVFIDGDLRVVNVVEHAKPLEEGPRYQSAKPARFVLELNAGRASALGLETGVELELLDLPETL